jgi:AraC-like DNA-binding protein
MHSPLEELHRCLGKVRFVGRHEGSDSFPRHWHDVWEVTYQRRGQVTTIQDTDTVRVTPGTIMVNAPRMPHADVYSGRYALYFVHLALEEQPPWPRVCYDDDHGTAGRIFEALCREFEGDAPGRDAQLSLLAAQLSGLLHRALSEQSQTTGLRTVIEAERILEERFREPLRVETLAREVGVSRATLYAQFAKHRQQTPPDCLDEIRLRHALHLLRASDHTLDAIAGDCGYYSASHLSRHVKAATGQSPGRLRSPAPR